MVTSLTIVEIAKALSLFQGELKPAKKDEVNPFFKMKYADLAGVWGVIREPLAKNGLSVAQLPHTENDKLFLTTLLLHNSGEWISSEMPVVAQKADSQSIGSALTYARRYSLSSMLGVAAEDDDGEGAGKVDDGLKATKEKPSSTLAKSMPVVVNKTSQPLTPLELYEASQKLPTGVALCNFAKLNGYTNDTLKTTLGVSKPADIKNVQVAAVVLFPKPNSLIEEAVKLGAKEIKEDGMHSSKTLV